ncbi:MAG: septal ring lytic transglycosylase RlpA family protein [Salinarimonas sp.]|nr:septal ring lytic transglycosylase RlpA family protein [Salinarimonas sp.]
MSFISAKLRGFRAIATLGLILAAAPIAFSPGQTGPGSPVAQASEQTRVAKTISGPASWYGGKFHGRTTANGERFDMEKLTAAHRSLPFGTRVRVTNERNGRSVVVRINDRGPFVGNRVIDLSRGAAAAVGMVRSGVAPVRIDVLM